MRCHYHAAHITIHMLKQQLFFYCDVLISGVVLYINVINETLESVLIREVSLLERCPY